METVIKCNTKAQCEKVIMYCKLSIKASDVFDTPTIGVMGINITNDRYASLYLYEDRNKDYPNKYSIKSFEEFIAETKVTSQQEINKTLLNSLSHRTGHIHYIKWNITSNLSIRYFYNFTDRPEYNMKFTLKNHKERTLVELDEKTAKEMIENVCKDEPYLEIIGYEAKGKNKGYRKLVMKNGEVSEIYETYNDKLIKN
jgi:hypothetical protein